MTEQNLTETKICIIREMSASDNPTQPMRAKKSNALEARMAGVRLLHTGMNCTMMTELKVTSA